ncbi:MAG TPA: hypothetical protein VFI02_05020 [Armatimonadota bacterium]|nr:hypothetical protein [Armatimonadota bacterium]
MASRLGRVHIALILLLIIVFFGLGVLLSVSRDSSRVSETPAPIITEKPSRNGIPQAEKSEEQLSWEKFAAEARAENNSNVSVDYDAYHQYGQEHFGVLVVAWKDSEYEVDLYHFDAEKRSWELSPVVQESVYATDVPTTSRKWGVPGNVIKGWIDRADTEVQKIYNQENE